MQKLLPCPQCQQPMLMTLHSYFCRRCNFLISQQKAKEQTQISREDRNFLKKINTIEEIVECYIITGEADFLLKVVCKDIPAYEQLLFKTLSQIEEIERLKTLMTLSTVKNSSILPFEYD